MKKKKEKESTFMDMVSREGWYLSYELFSSPTRFRVCMGFPFFCVCVENPIEKRLYYRP